MEEEVDVIVTTTTSTSSDSPGLDDDAPPAPVLFIGDEPSAARRAARTLGAWGALPQETSAAELCAAVRALAQGLVAGTPQLLFSPDDQSPDGSPLTEREAEVLRWLAQGLANKQIAAQLGISEHTVKFHVSSIYTKLNATNRTQAVREGLRNGWIPL
jgi:DNA-binding NarL/FixJ family response regulator